MKVPVGPEEAVGYLRGLLDFVDVASEKAASFILPGLEIALRSNSPRFGEICDRVLVNDARYVDAGGPSASVAVLDETYNHNTPLGAWYQDPFVPGELIEATSASGLAVVHDFGCWQVFDPVGMKGVHAMPSFNALPPWDRSFPLRNFLYWAYRASGRHLIHAGTLGLGHKGILLGGDSGAGKSGTTLAGVMRGMTSVGDDYVVLEVADSLLAQPVVKLMRQDAAGLSRNGISPSDIKAGSANWQGKFEFDFEDLGRGRRPTHLELKAILIPKKGASDRAQIVPASSTEAMNSLGLSTLRQLPGHWGERMRTIADLARRLPSFQLLLTENPAEVADVVMEFVEKRV